MATGYSGTPLAKKLSLRDGMRVWFDAMPEHVFEEIAEYALDLTIVALPGHGIDGAHIFVTERDVLATRLQTLRSQIAPDGQVWVSWPKKAANVPTDIIEDTIRELALPLGFVDTKVCAIDETWSGLKLVIRKDLRQAAITPPA
ncbi:Protein of unknown function (DUF3052) [Novosphingobium kunmingense]|uniref:DUF3052 family protein n=1 Tax=Novosphingobium kunmingense TaxID=1211806 RepID=A0A2N0I221_9SPHN|nr:DUF3052 family protein [Novosphingobium kunmingense]PKB25222.1 Protein of unknown function (DUF3052) [Novosphingobium kunmingense]